MAMVVVVAVAIFCSEFLESVKHYSWVMELVPTIMGRSRQQLNEEV